MTNKEHRSKLAIDYCLFCIKNAIDIIEAVKKYDYGMALVLCNEGIARSVLYNAQLQNAPCDICKNGEVVAIRVN